MVEKADHQPSSAEPRKHPHAAEEAVTVVERGEGSQTSRSDCTYG
jgi:hypothetical protein